MATKYYLDQPGLERLVDYINNSLDNKANIGDIPANVVVKADLADYALKSDIPESADLRAGLIFDSFACITDAKTKASSHNF